MKNKAGKIIFGVVLALVLFMVIGVGMYGFQEVRKERQSYEDYEKAFNLYKEGKYEEAEKILVTIPNYEGVEEMLTDLYYRQGCEAFEAGDYAKARELFQKNTEYQDTMDYIRETAYQLGVAAFQNGDYATARSYFSEIPNHKDVPDYERHMVFFDMQSYVANGQYAEAENCILSISDYPGIEPYGIVVLSTQAAAAFENQDYEHSLDLYERAFKYCAWIDAYEALSPEEQAAYAQVAGETSFRERQKQMEKGQEAAIKEYQVVTCLKDLSNIYQQNMAETASISEVKEVRIGQQAYSSDNIVPVIMIYYKEQAVKNKKQQDAYAVYNETEFYAICHSLEMEELDKSNSDEVQANLKLTKYWEDKKTEKMDMERLRKAMGWQ